MSRTELRLLYGEYCGFGEALVDKLLEIRDNPEVYGGKYEKDVHAKWIGVTINLVTSNTIVGYQIRVVAKTEDGIFEHLKTRDSLSTWEWDGESEIITWEMLENI